jgi:hypothetical protein
VKEAVRVGIGVLVLVNVAVALGSGVLEGVVARVEVVVGLVAVAVRVNVPVLARTGVALGGGGRVKVGTGVALARSSKAGVSGGLKTSGGTTVGRLPLPACGVRKESAQTAGVRICAETGRKMTVPWAA